MNRIITFTNTFYFKVFKNYSRPLAPVYQIMARNYDIVVYGATGFTGQYVVEELARVAALEEQKGEKKQTLKWAVAGRNKAKLHKTLTAVEKVTGISLKSVGIIEADNTKQESLSNMAAQAKVIVNCVGPYDKYGEPTVKACIEQKTNEIDISPEPQFLEGMRLKYDKAAEEAGVHIVGACGIEALPADVGLCHMIKNFAGELNSAECYFQPKGPSHTGHSATIESVALLCANLDRLKDIRKQLYTEELPKPKFEIEKRKIIHKSYELGQPMWSIPFTLDESMVYATQRYLCLTKGRRLVQFKGFASFPSFFKSFGALAGVMYLIGICLVGWTRTLVVKYPAILTFGLFTRKGATREALDRTSFTSTIVAKGWAEKLSASTDEYSTPPDTKITCKISGPDPGYRATSLMMVASAITVLREKDNCERRGGIMTPGIAFMNTKLIDRITERGMTVTLEI